MRKSNLIIGRHVSFKSPNYLLDSIKESKSYQANTFMFYTGAPQNTKRKSFTNDEINHYLEELTKNDFQTENLVIHAPYIVNCASSENYKRDFAEKFMLQEMQRAQQFKIKYIVLHPGNHLNHSVDTALRNCLTTLNKLLSKNLDITICIETMAGKGTEICKTFQEINYLLTHCKYKDNLKVCFDTCHVYDAGYDLKNNLEGVINEFDKIVGLDQIKVFHINDSKFGFNSHKDRHENIGYGKLGFNAISSLIHHPKIPNVPMILETPAFDAKNKNLHKIEIDLLKNQKYLDDWRNIKN